jgi:AcrR family transcriptional regulator
MRERILDAATKLFVEEGYERTTMRRIADVIEYTPGAIYSYFKDKDEICYALHHRGFEKLNRMTALALERVKDPWDRLYVAGRTYIRFALENQALYDLMFVSRETGRSIAEGEWEPGAEAYAGLHNTVEAFLAHYGLDWDIDTVAFGAWAVVHGLVSLVVCDRCAMIPAEQHAYLVQSGYDHHMKLLRTTAELVQRDERMRRAVAPPVAPEAVKAYHAKLRAAAAKKGTPATKAAAAKPRAPKAAPSKRSTTRKRAT